jgi:DNA/RNA endonuclease YhcR with UshA esterase domain
MSKRRPKKAVKTTNLAPRLRKALAKRTKDELLDVLVELAEEDRDIFRRLATRMELETPPPELAAATRQAIADATDFDERDINRNFSYDYEAYGEVKRNLCRLIDLRELHLAGKRIQVLGKLVEYRDKPEIIVTHPEQVVISSDVKQAPVESSQGAARRATVIDVTDKTAIAAAMPQEAAVAGVVSNVDDNEGVAVINFTGTEESKFYAVVLKRNREAVGKVHGEGFKSLVGKRVEVTGKIVEYRENPQIVISLPEQIILDDK